MVGISLALGKFRGHIESYTEYSYDLSKSRGGFHLTASSYIETITDIQRAGQLGDGRAISLFETTNPNTGKRYELQLKGAGMTPYSRFADGKAVLRSSIREFVVSEALHALGIPSTRALSLTLLPHEQVRRERFEPGAIVARFAESWLRVGTFDLLRARGDRALIRTLADHILNQVLPSFTPMIPLDETIQSKAVLDVVKKGNRYTHLYHHLVSLSAITVAKWQAYGFMNGVLNTDNTSLLGLSMDFGPFAFMDDFDPHYTPNHDDHMSRYSYQNQPSIIWWNLVRLGEALGELMGVGAKVDDANFIATGVPDEDIDTISTNAEKIILAVGDSYKTTFLDVYKRTMAMRLGVKSLQHDDSQDLLSEALDMLQDLQLDFNHFFRRLGQLSISELATESQRIDKAGIFFHREGCRTDEDSARKRIAAWLDTWRDRIIQDWSVPDGVETPTDSHRAWDRDRQLSMHAVNPAFLPRSWILDEIIQRVEKQGDTAVLQHVMKLVLQPFDPDRWEACSAEETQDQERWCADVPKVGRGMQCSCSS